MFTEERINCLRKEISTLEWDIQFIKDSSTKARKEERLSQYKAELNEMQKKRIELELT